MSEKKSVMIVDDEPEIGNLLKIFLEDDFNVVTFTDPKLACDEVAKNFYNVVVSDIKMPLMTGLDVLKHVKKTRPETHVVLITGHAQTDRDKAEATGLGAAGVLFKPFGDPAKIVDYLNEVVGSKTLVSTNSQSGVTPATVSAVTISTTPNAAQNAGKPLVMAIDDEPDLIEILSMLLSDDFDVRTFNDPVVALKRFEEDPYDVVLTDLHMPHLSGLDVITRIRKLKPHLPIVIMSGHAESEPEVVAALKAGGTTVLPKPFPEPDIVLNKIGKLIKK